MTGLNVIAIITKLAVEVAKVLMDLMASIALMVVFPLLAIMALLTLMALIALMAVIA